MPIPTSQIESGLTPPILISGEPPQTFALPERLAHYAVPALSLALIDQGEVAWVKAYGVRATGDPLAATPHTQFQAASISKPVAALAALRLAAEGRLDLDADVNTYLRTWTLPSNDLTRQQPVTVRRLLSHTAGATVHGFPGYALDAPLPTVVEILEGLSPANTAPIRVDLLPGTAMRYSGGGYVVLQQLLMDLTGETYPALVQRLVFDPLGMAHSGYSRPDPQDPLVALGHLRTGERVPGGFHVYPEYAAAGLWTTPTDLAFLALGLSRAYTGARDAVLPQPLAQALLTSHPVAGSSYALGLNVMGEGDWLSFAHGGDNYGYKCLFVGYPKRGQGLALMTNGERGESLYMEVLRSVAQVYGWPGHDAKLKTLAPAAPAAWTAYAGRYVLTDYPVVSLTIAPQADTLTVTLEQPGGTTSAAMFPEAANRFFRRDVDTEIAFELPAADGLAPALTIYQDGLILPARRA